jgi:iron complex transport system ATP-binding protein
MVELKNVSYVVGDTRILEDINARFQPGRFNVLLGPNGAGKSTLLKIATGLLEPTRGLVLMDGRPISDFRDHALAKKRAVMSQNIDLAFSLPVKDVVLMGRYPHYGQSPTSADLEIVMQAIDLVGLASKSEQEYPTLSGGERQKTHLARVLAQIWADGSTREPRYLFLDEPTSELDIHYELQTLQVARSLLGHDCTVVAVMHDLNVATQYGDAFFFLDGGRVVHETTDRNAISREWIESVFAVKARKIIDPEDGHSFWRFGL